MRWKELLPPVQEATTRLLSLLQGVVGYAEDASRATNSNRRDFSVATGLLVSGHRGCGKTTVLRSAQLATDDARKFFEDSSVGPQDPTYLTATALKGNVIWLAPLDLEGLPPTANLLAAALVRIRDALEPSDQGKAGKEHQHASILETDAETSYDLIGQLISDAAYMWEDATEGDARSRSAHQVKAAEIQAGFSERLRRTMDSVIPTLRRRRRCEGERAVILLPIDNVDRSAEHLHHLFRLLGALDDPRLWLVLAAGRPDFHEFLNRAVARELNGGRQQTEDTLLAIARRQATATERKALPPSHRVLIENVSIGQALGFPAVSDGGAATTPRPTLRALLAQVHLWHHHDQKVGPFIDSLLDLFIFDDKRLHASVIKALEAARGRDQSKVADAKSEAGHDPLEDQRRHDLLATQAGRHTLTLSARHLVDFWQAMRQEPDKTGEGAVGIVHEMLGQAIAESDLPEWASARLTTKLVRRNPRREVIPTAGPARGLWNLDDAHACVTEVEDPEAKQGYDDYETSPSEVSEVSLEGYEQAVLGRLGDLYKQVRDKTELNDRAGAARRWLLEELPLLFCPEYGAALPPRIDAARLANDYLDALFRRWDDDAALLSWRRWSTLRAASTPDATTHALWLAFSSSQPDTTPLRWVTGQPPSRAGAKRDEIAR